MPQRAIEPAMIPALGQRLLQRSDRDCAPGQRGDLALLLFNDCFENVHFRSRETRVEGRAPNEPSSSAPALDPRLSTLGYSSSSFTPCILFNGQPARSHAFT